MMIAGREGRTVLDIVPFIGSGALFPMQGVLIGHARPERDPSHADRNEADCKWFLPYDIAYGLTVFTTVVAEILAGVIPCALEGHAIEEFVDRTAELGTLVFEIAFYFSGGPVSHW